MNIQVTGQQIDVGDALRQYVTETVETISNKYFNHVIESSVSFAPEGSHLIRVNITISVGRGIVLQAQGEADAPYPAFDDAAEKIAKRLRRYKGRLRNHHKRAEETPESDLTAATYYMLGTQDSEQAGNEDGADGAADDADTEADEPVIVAEMPTQIENMSVSEAVMRMELGELPALMFRNTKHNGLNMVYRRADGHVGWVDPAEAKEDLKTGAAATPGAEKAQTA